MIEHRPAKQTLTNHQHRYTRFTHFSDFRVSGLFITFHPFFREILSRISPLFQAHLSKRKLGSWNWCLFTTFKANKREKKMFQNFSNVDFVFSNFRICRCLTLNTARNDWTFFTPNKKINITCIFSSHLVSIVTTNTNI